MHKILAATYDCPTKTGTPLIRADETWMWQHLLECGIGQKTNPLASSGANEWGGAQEEAGGGSTADTEGKRRGKIHSALWNKHTNQQMVSSSCIVTGHLLIQGGETPTDKHTYNDTRRSTSVYINAQYQLHFTNSESYMYLRLYKNSVRVTLSCIHVTTCGSVQTLESTIVLIFSNGLVWWLLKQMVKLTL